MGALPLHSSLLILERDVFESSYIRLAVSANQKWKNEPSTSGQTSKIGSKSACFLGKR